MSVFKPFTSSRSVLGFLDHKGGAVVMDPVYAYRLYTSYAEHAMLPSGVLVPAGLAQELRSGVGSEEKTCAICSGVKVGGVGTGQKAGGGLGADGLDAANGGAPDAVGIRFGGAVPPPCFFWAAGGGGRGVPPVGPVAGCTAGGGGTGVPPLGPEAAYLGKKIEGIEKKVEGIEKKVEGIEKEQKGLRAQFEQLRLAQREVTLDQQEAYNAFKSSQRDRVFDIMVTYRRRVWKVTALIASSLCGLFGTAVYHAENIRKYFDPEATKEAVGSSKTTKEAVGSSETTKEASGATAEEKSSLRKAIEYLIACFFASCKRLGKSVLGKSMGNDK